MTLLIIVNDSLKLLFDKVSALSDSINAIQNIAVQNKSPLIEYAYWWAQIAALIVVSIYAYLTWKTYRQIKEQSGAIIAQSETTKETCNLFEKQTQLMTEQTANLLNPALYFEFEKSKSIDELYTKYGKLNVLDENDCLKYSESLSENVFNTLSPYFISSIPSLHDKIKSELYSIIIKNPGNGIVERISITLLMTINVPEKFLETHMLSFPYNGTLLFNSDKLLQAKETRVVPLIYIGLFPIHRLEIIEGTYTDFRNNSYSINSKIQEGKNEDLQELLNQLCI